MNILDIAKSSDQELKDHLQKLELPTNGTKRELIIRLVDKLYPPKEPKEPKLPVNANIKVSEDEEKLLAREAKFGPVKRKADQIEAPSSKPHKMKREQIVKLTADELKQELLKKELDTQGTEVELLVRLLESLERVKKPKVAKPVEVTKQPKIATTINVDPEVLAKRQAKFGVVVPSAPPSKKNRNKTQEKVIMIDRRVKLKSQRLRLNNWRNEKLNLGPSRNTFFSI